MLVLYSVMSHLFSVSAITNSQVHEEVQGLHHFLQSTIILG